MSICTEEGTVTKVVEDRVCVRVRRSSACGECGSKGACSSLGGGEFMESEALNTANAKEGDRVLLKIPSTSLFRISFILYMLPVIFLALGIVAGMKLAPDLAIDSQVSAILFGVLGFGVSVVIIMFFSKRVKDNKDYMPEVMRIIK